MKRLVLTLLFALLVGAANVAAQTSTFTYQGRLTDSTMTANGAYDLQFTLYDENNPAINTITRDDVPVSNGVFTVQLDFGAAAFPGATRTLEIAVRRGAETGAYTTLAPRQPVTSTPYAIRAASAATATTATNATNATNAQTAATANSLSAACVGCVTNQQINSVDGAKITNGGGIANLNASNLASGTVPLARLGTNAPTPNSFLRGDNTWAGGVSGVTLQLSATNTAAQTITQLAGSNTPQNISFNNVITAPTTGTFDGTTFTATSAGTYLITAIVVPVDGVNNGTVIQLAVNGTTTVSGSYGLFSSGGTQQNRFNSTVSFVLALNANDQVLIRGVAASTSTGSTLSTNGTTRLAIVKLN